MNKRLSATGIGAAVLGVTMWHAAAVREANWTDDARPTLLAGQTTEGSEGPWLASCRYWSPSNPNIGARDPAAPAAAQKPATPGKVDKHKPENQAGSVAPKGCGSDNWGIPESRGPHAPDIRAIIATVPDPVHSHFALEFDRTIDAFMQAAGDNRYLGDQYWLPWKGPLPRSATKGEARAPAETEQDLKREDEPGLIILKYGPRPSEPDAAWTSYYRVVYLFLVSETPALGVHGAQLRNALKYEAMLTKAPHAKLSMKEDRQLAVIGPFFSGSASSLRQGLESLNDFNFAHDPSGISVTGETSTDIASTELNAQQQQEPKLTYVSFAENSAFELSQFFQTLYASRYDVRRIAVLVEDGTAFGDANSKGKRGGLQIRFPREISLLRNAEVTGSGEPSKSTNSPPTPYLSLSLRDTDGDDTVPHFSTTQFPLSQEAQLMAIARQLLKNRTQYVLIAGSNILDEIFLAQFLHRACPDATLVFYNGGDLLIERDVDNLSYIGSIVVTPYTLIDFEQESGTARAFSDAHAERAYNAASYTFWPGGSNASGAALPTLAGYQHPSRHALAIPLWATAVGRDGYYPLGLLCSCASDNGTILPTISQGTLTNCAQKQFTPTLSSTSPNAAPSLLWYVLCTLIAGFSIGHISVMLSAEYWSPFTRDLAVRQNDQPRRRSVYINIGTSVLFCMAFVVSFPLFAMLFPLGHRMYLIDAPSFTAATITLLTGFGALITTVSRTSRHSTATQRVDPDSGVALYPYFNLLALLTAVVVPVLWVWICLRSSVGGTASYTGLFFSYRSLHPASGVSPVVPILLLLFSWLLWAIFQAARLRFSTMSRPRLPDNIPSASSYPLFVTDTAITECASPVDSCLIENVTCLLITRETIRRFSGFSPRKLNVIFFGAYMALFALCIFCGRIHSLERFLLLPGHWPTAYELLIAALFFPLIVVALTGWLRMILIWGALSRGVLEPLERTPLRGAFNRIKEVGWMAMLSQSSLHIRWRDMARSTESLRQLINNPDLAQAVGTPARWKELSDTYHTLLDQIAELRKRMGMRQPPLPQPRPPAIPPGDDDLPEPEHIYDLGYIYTIEKLYAEFCERLLSYVLVPYWSSQRVGFVEDIKASETGHSGAAANSGPDLPQDPVYIRLAEELLAIRYVALIRSVLVNIRFLMLFVSSAFVLATIAWNSYPFQPHQLIDWCFTLLLVFLGCGFVWVFAQMHRNAILSRITDTKPNELGRDFYIRIASFGAVPLLTWFAYQFPEVGVSLFRLLQPGLQVFK